MLKYIQIIIIFNLFTIELNPIHANQQILENKITFELNAPQSMNHNGYVKKFTQIRIKNSLKFETNNFSSKLHFSLDNDNNVHFDHSYLQKTTKNLTYGFGMIDRNWSFSPKSSLILSSNARPFKSIYLKLDNSGKHIPEWIESLDIINGFTKSSLSSTDPMLFGLRLLISPSKKLKFEFLRTFQWGGAGYNDSISQIHKTLTGDTNENTLSNINQMAGFGISYTLYRNKYPINFYTQIIGEDEAGSLPSCNMYMLGLTTDKPIFSKLHKIGIEYTNTIIGHTKHNFCGPNTAYNNYIYKYSNYGAVMGANIDTAGSSLEIFTEANISSNIETKFSLKKVLINSSSSPQHRLSSNRQEGWISTANIAIKRNNKIINGTINYQSFPLDKIASSAKLGVGISATISF
jgi:hypothetical protein